jgi:hypothetical protein
MRTLAGNNHVGDAVGDFLRHRSRATAIIISSLKFAILDRVTPVPSEIFLNSSLPVWKFADSEQFAGARNHRFCPTTDKRNTRLVAVCGPCPSKVAVST